jgi:uracil-DNA glycosylase
VNDPDRLADLVAEVRGCTICNGKLPLGPRPILQIGTDARIVIVGQAPGRRVHESGVPWADPSGDRLRVWLAVDDETFYDPDKIALVPMGFCYPGTGRSGDLPPRPECAPTWHPRILSQLPQDRLTILIGRYAQARYLAGPAATLTETVRGWRDHLPTIVLPHPSPRNQRWLRSNPWFDEELIPEIRTLVTSHLTR